MIELVVAPFVVAASFVAGGFLWPKVEAWFKGHADAKALADAQKLVANAEAAEKQLAAARIKIASATLKAGA